MHLGQTQHNIRNGKAWKAYRLQLEEVGLDFTPQQLSFDQTYQALKIFKDINNLKGTFSVPNNFIIPQNEQWPEELWNIKLGDIQHKIKTGTSLKSHRHQFEELGFDFETDRRKNFNIILVALKAYKNINKLDGVFSLESNFIVPSSDPWPRIAWGINIGEVCTNMKYKEQLYRKELIEIGIDSYTPTLPFNLIKSALLAFKKVYNIEGSVVIPSKFIIPFDNYEWPFHTWGLHLGNVNFIHINIFFIPSFN